DGCEQLSLFTMVRVEDDVVMQNVRVAGERSSIAAAGELEIALQETIADFAADMLIRVVPHIPAKGGAGMKPGRGRPEGISGVDGGQKASAGDAAEFPLLRKRRCCECGG